MFNSSNLENLNDTQTFSRTEYLVLLLALHNMAVLVGFTS